MDRIHIPQYLLAASLGCMLLVSYAMAQPKGKNITAIAVEATEEDFIHQNDVQLKKALDLMHEKIGYKRPAAAPAQVSRRPAVHH